MQKIVIICGPTSSGKTAIAMKAAEEFNAEIVSADSRQIYRYLDIGTNKGNLTESKDTWYLGDIPIHLVNIKNPNERYSVYDFKNDSEKKFQDIFARGKNILLVGGTGLYIDSIYRNYVLTDSFENKYGELNINELKNLYKEKYPEEYMQLNYSDQNNPRRLSMHLSKLDAGVELNMSQDRISKDSDRQYLFIYPEFTREDLRLRIDKRVDEMFREGIVEETSRVLELFGKDSVALRGIGYREIIDHLEGKISLEECIKQVKYSHNQYAKRQITWFEGTGRNYPLKKVGEIDDTMKLVRTFLSN
jgi:tRNA dimethylallyltransferase